MNLELFDRLKKIAKKEGKIVFADEEDVFVILPLLEYEMLTEDLYGEECGCDDENCGCRHDHNGHDLDFDNDFDFGEEIFAKNKDNKKPEDVEKEDETDKDLIKRVNEDIAKWREEQTKQKDHNNNDDDTKKRKEATDLSNAGVEPEVKEDVLTEEERYYLEPLE